MSIERRYSLIGHGHTGAGIDHGLLTGLSDDDHPQYPLLAGTETITGTWTFDHGGVGTTGPTFNNYPLFATGFECRGYIEFNTLAGGADYLSWYWVNNDAALNEKVWILETDGSAKSFALRHCTDAYGSYKNQLELVRSGNVTTNIYYGNSTDNPAHTFYGSVTINGNVTLGTDNYLTLDEHSSAPSTPAAGKVSVYAKADGKLYIKDDAGTETDLTAAGSAASDIDTEIDTDNPIGWWKCSEASGNLADSSGNAYTLTATGTPAVYARAALDPDFSTRTSLKLIGDASNYFESSAQLGQTMPLTTWSLEFWGVILAGSTIPLFAFMDLGETEAVNSMIFLRMLSTGGMENIHEYGAGTNETTTTDVPVFTFGKFHHFVVTKDSATKVMKYYVDGRCVYSTTYTNEATGGTTATFSLGAHPDGGGAPGAALIGGCAIYNTVLSYTRVAAHARAVGVLY